MAPTPRSDADRKKVAQEVLAAHGTTYAEEIGVRLADTPSPLFQWLCAAILFSAPIGAGQAVKGARALRKAGLTTPKKMAEATWDQRRKPLTESGYARYDEKTATMLGDTARLILDEWKGDLRRLHEACGGDRGAMRAQLKRVKGLGDVGVDIFFREVQAVWPDLAPFADGKALKAARALGLLSRDDAAALRDLVPEKDFPRFVAGLVRVDLAHDADEVRGRALH